MRHLLFLVNAEELYGFGGAVVRRTKRRVYDNDGRASPNSCFGLVSAGIIRALAMSGQERLLKSAEKLRRSWLSLTTHYTISLRWNGSFRQL